MVDKPKRSLSKLGRLFGAGRDQEPPPQTSSPPPPATTHADAASDREEALRALRNGLAGLQTGKTPGHAPLASIHSQTTTSATTATAGTHSGVSTPRTPSDSSYALSPQTSPKPLTSRAKPPNGVVAPNGVAPPNGVAASNGVAPPNGVAASHGVAAAPPNGAVGSGSASPVIRSQPVSRSSSVKNTQANKNASFTNIAAINQPRFKILESGNHEHHLRSAKRQEKLSNMLKDLLGAKRLRDEAKSEVPNILNTSGNSAVASPAATASKPPTLFAGLVHQVKNNTSPYHNSQGSSSAANIGFGQSEQGGRSFVEKYGRCQEVIGRGSFGVVRVSHKKADASGAEILYAVKEFKRKPLELDQKYNRRLTSEFCISSSLKHINIIDTLDLLKDAKGDYCEVMEFCSGGDLYTLIIALGKLEYAEADCFFKQLIRGVNYMHEMGVSHRDLKPENVLLTQRGVLKITDFGNGECFRMAWESDVQLSEGICGSSPYIAPEEFTQKQFDPRGVDIWACGVIYMAMRTGRQLWKLADPKEDEFFQEYLEKRKDAAGYEPIESLKRARCRNVIYSILDPKPQRRINGKQILNSEWGREIKVCAAGEAHEDVRY